MSAALADLPALTPVTDQDRVLAARAVRAHVPENWPHGLLCRGERAPYPCRLARCGRASLAAAGLSEGEMA
ncbi:MULTISPECIES: hypothetical protein [unclassified Micromonospora]|uniref:hypothetical protein n=1 Tax=unclassified Micromonospora TaxID=2617518 RepID=UPI002FEEE717